MLTRTQIAKALTSWQRAWESYDLEDVMALFHEDVLSENWTGARVQGKCALHRAWGNWFAEHGGFRFYPEDTFIDIAQQKVLYRWRLEWPSREPGFEGKPETRRGVDILQFKDGLIIRKLTYAQTVIEVEGRRIQLRPSVG